MPLTVEDFLSLDPELLSLRRSLAYTPPESRDRQRLLRLIVTREEQARGRWMSGLEGWMTSDEAAVIVAELLEQAAGRVAGAEVREDQLVFTGARTEQVLSLSATNPVRARKHWSGYLEACPVIVAPAAPTTSKPAAQLDLGALLGTRVGRRPRERSRMLGIPIPRRDGR